MPTPPRPQVTPILSRPNQPGLFLYAPIASCSLAALLLSPPAFAQIPPSPSETAAYAGLHAAAAKGDAAEIERLIAAGEKVERAGRP